MSYYKLHSLCHFFHITNFILLVTHVILQISLSLLHMSYYKFTLFVTYVKLQTSLSLSHMSYIINNNVSSSFLSFHKISIHWNTQKQCSCVYHSACLHISWYTLAYSGWPGHYNNVGCSVKMEISFELNPVTECK